MKDSRVFKSDEGRDKILSFYRKILSQVEFEYEERFIDTSYGKTYLLTAGDKRNPVLMLFHGSCSSSIMWLGDMGSLCKDFFVVSVDVVGEAGSSDENRLNPKTDDHAKWIDEIVTSLNVTKVNLMGNSFGAWLSLKYAVSFPRKVDKIILIAPSGIVNVNLSFVMKSIWYIMLGDLGTQKMNKLIFGTDDIPKDVLTFQELIMKNFKPMIGGLPVFSDDELKKLRNPILFICGENDVTLSVKKASVRLSNLCENTEINILEGFPHAIYGQTEKIARFLKK